MTILYKAIFSSRVINPFFTQGINKIVENLLA